MLVLEIWRFGTDRSIVIHFISWLLSPLILIAHLSLPSWKCITILLPTMGGPWMQMDFEQTVSCRSCAITGILHWLSGLSISPVRRPGLSNLALGLASKALNKSSGIVYPYLSNQWYQSKVWPINSHLHFMRSSFLRSSNTAKKASLKKI